MVPGTAGFGAGVGTAASRETRFLMVVIMGVTGPVNETEDRLWVLELGVRVVAGSYCVYESALELLCLL